MVERIRDEFRRVTSGESNRGRMSQAELDAYRRQLVLLAITVTATLLIIILAVGVIYQYVYLPRQSVATVNGETIRRSDYWDFRRYELLGQVNQYQQIAQFMEGDQANQYLQLAFEANQEFENVEDAPIDPMTVDQLITNQILMDAVDEMGIEITDQDVDDRLFEYFTGMSVPGNDDEPTADPTAIAWATATAEAQQAEADAQQAETGEAEDEAESDPSDGEQFDDDSENDEADESSADDGVEETDDDGDDSETEATPEPEPTPSEADMRATAEATQSDHQEFLLDRAGLSHAEFVEMFIKPDIAREKIQERLAEDIPTRGEQVEAAHILVATQDAAQLIYEELTDGGADFEQLAEEQSTDTQTAPNGGDLGWFPRGVMVEEFDEVVFSLDVGEISEPFQSDFGWHIATVNERDDDRPIELMILQQQRQRAFTEWLDERRATADIDTDYALPDDGGAPPTQFQPPASAPQPPPPEIEMQPQPPEEIPDEGDEGEDVVEEDDPIDNADDEG